MLSEIEPKKELIESVKKGALHTKIEININLGNAVIVGFLTNVYEDKLIAYTDSKIYRKHIILVD